jgi:acetamidase/formamidase
MVRIRLVHLTCAACMAIPAPGHAQQPRAQTPERPLAGVWVLWRRNFGSDFPVRLHIEGRGDSLIATASNGLQATGRATGGRLALSGKAADRRTDLRLEVGWQGDSLVGTSSSGDQTVPTWLVRERTRPSSAPTRQLFRPTAFHRVFSSAITAALHLWPGDTVRTETVSAGGMDSTGTRRALGGNPLTGPFWIEGALPGDVLVVHLLRVRTSSTAAGSGSGLAWNAVTPQYLADYEEAEDSGSTWLIDPVARVSRLKTPGEAMRAFSVPLRPMLGCVGVAPGAVGRAETRSSGFPGQFGGNMDYNRVVEGATVSLQVNLPGAFLFLGDGHAAQGDGELMGFGLETPMDIEFSLELIRDKRIGFPRIEDATHLMSVGVAGSLDRAFQIATTGLARWLEQEYKVTRSEAAMVMGTAVEYDIAEVVDGDLNIVAKLSKAVLSGIPKRP